MTDWQKLGGKYQDKVRLFVSDDYGSIAFVKNDTLPFQGVTVEIHKAEDRAGNDLWIFRLYYMNTRVIKDVAHKENIAIILESYMDQLIL